MPGGPVSVKLEPRSAQWIETNDVRCIPSGPGVSAPTAYKGEFVMVIVGPSFDECAKLFCSELLRIRGEFRRDE